MPLFLFFSVLSAEAPVVSIDSARANYDGKQIILDGDVVVEHELGKICAKHIVLTPEDDQKKLSIARLKMQEDVRLELKDGGQLLCSTADLDYLKMEGRFLGNRGQEYVIYSENCKGDKRLPLLFKSREMHVQLKREDDKKTSVSEMTAYQNVTLNYNHDFIASSDHATYKRSENVGEDTHVLPGSICLKAADTCGMCQITNKNGDLIRSNAINIDTVKQNMSFTYPRGFINTTNKQSKPEKLTFESDDLKWDDQLKVLTFVGNIKIDQKSYGELLGEDEVRLYYTEENGKKKIKEVESLGETVIAHIDDDKKLIHTLTSYGKTTVDHLLLTTTIESPLDSNGNVIEGTQIYFHDVLGEIYADKAVLDYKETDGLVTLEKLTLKGNVRILNRSNVNPEESEAFLQYALTDIAEFYPATSELLMTAEDNARVLFYDKANNLSVSATGVKIKRNAMTKKESIQGIGDARFSLVDHELDKLKTHFCLEPANKSPL